MAKVVLRRHGDAMTLGEFTKQKPTYDELLKLNQDLKAELISQLELQNEITRYKNAYTQEKKLSYALKTENTQLREAIRATDVNDLLEAARTILKKD